MYGAPKTPLFYILFDISITPFSKRNATFIYGPFVKKLSFRFLIACVLSDLAQYIASILKICFS